MKGLKLIGWLAVVGIGAACTRRVSTVSMAARELPCPAAVGSGEPNLTVSPDGRALLSWIEPAGEKRRRLRYAERRPAGTWSEPLTIAEGENWFVNWADFPSVAVLTDGTLFAHWLAKSGPGTYAYDLQVAVSSDGGKSWKPPVVPHQDGTKTEHGFVSMTPWDPRTIGLIWLDGRKTAGGSTGGHQGHAGLQAEMALVHGTVGTDGRLGAETILDGRVCDCCQTDAAVADGATVVVYRDRSEKEVRDMSVVRFSEGRWSEPVPLARDNWQIDGCPVNGPAIAAEGREVAAAWFTSPQERSRVNVAFSSDSGASFGSPIAVDDGRPVGRVDVVLGERGALVSWLEQAEKGVELRLRHVAPSGSRGKALTIADSSAARSSGFPRMVRSGDEIVVAWRDSADPPRVRTAVVTGVAPAR